MAQQIKLTNEIIAKIEEVKDAELEHAMMLRRPLYGRGRATFNERREATTKQDDLYCELADLVIAQVDRPGYPEPVRIAAPAGVPTGMLEFWYSRMDREWDFALTLDELSPQQREIAKKHMGSMIAELTKHTTNAPRIAAERS